MPKSNFSVRLSTDGADKVKRDLRELGETGQRALQRVERATAPASKGLLAVNAVSREARGTMMGYAGQAGAVGAGLTALGPGGLAAAAGIAAVAASMRAMLRGARNAIGVLDQLDDTAQKLGVSVEALQEYRFAFEQNGVSIQAMEMALQRLSRRMGEIANFGKGEAAGAFRELGISIQGADGRLKSVEDVLPEIADALAKVEDQTRRLSLAQKLFDSEGVVMVNVLQQGSQALEQLRARARDLGVVVDEEVVRRASEANDELAAMERIVDAQLNAALTDLAPVVVAIAAGFAEMAKFVGDAVDALRDMEDMSTGGLGVRLVELQNDLEMLHRRRTALTDANAKVEGGAPSVNAMIADVDAQIRAKFDEVQRINAELEKRQKARNSATPAPVLGGGGLPGEDTWEKDMQKALADAKRQREQAVRFYGQIRQENLRAHNDEVGLIEQRRDRHLEALEDMALTEEEQAQARVLINETSTLQIEDHMRSLTAAGSKTFSTWSEDLGTFSRSFGQTVADAVVDADKGFGDITRSFKRMVAEMIAQRTVGRAVEFGLDALFGSFGFEDGGIMTAGGPARLAPLPINAYSGGGIADRPQVAVFGEGDTDEAFVPVPSGRIPVELRMRGGLGGGVQIHQTNNIDARGADESVLGRMEVMLEQSKRETVALTLQAVSRQADRGGAFAQTVGRR